MFSVTSDIAQAQRKITNIVREQIPFATSVAINDVAKKSQATMPSVFERQLDRPKPFTAKSSIFLKFAKKTDLHATVGIKDIQARYLAAVLAGKTRAQKPVEQKFLGRYFVPSRTMPVDSFGNVSKSTLLAILKSVTSGAPVWKGKRVFVVLERAGLAPGVYAGDKIKSKTKTRKVEPLLFFVDQPPTYSQRIDFPMEIERVVRAEFQGAFERAYRKAVETAK